MEALEEYLSLYGWCFSYNVFLFRLDYFAVTT